MESKRVLIVDDSVVYRVILSRMVREEPDMKVVGVASDGVDALEKIRSLDPNIVVLDVDMPRLDGLGALVEIRREWPDLPVLMCSALTQRGAGTVVEALFRGASDCIAKPTTQGDGPQETLRRELIDRIRTLTRLLPVSSSAAPSGVLAPQAAPVALTQTPGPRPGLDLPPVAPRRGLSSVEVVVIGTSTGGPGALVTVLKALPASLPVPVLVVQHMPPVFTNTMAKRLDEQVPLTVREAVDGAIPRAGEVWIAPGGYHMALREGAQGRWLSLNQDPPEHSCRPAVDVLFRSAARVARGATLAVVMTGMGRDGAEGCRLVHEAGGQVVIQDEKTSAVWGMPGAVAAANLQDVIVPLPEIAPEILRRVHASGRLPSSAPRGDHSLRRTS